MIVGVKDDFQSVLHHSLSTPMFVSLANWKLYESMLFITSSLPYLRGILNIFSSSFFDFYSYCMNLCHQLDVMSERTKHKAFASIMAVDMKMLKSLCVTSCKMLHFVTSYMNQSTKT